MTQGTYSRTAMFEHLLAEKEEEFESVSDRHLLEQARDPQDLHRIRHTEGEISRLEGEIARLTAKIDLAARGNPHVSVRLPTQLGSGGTPGW